MTGKPCRGGAVTAIAGAGRTLGAAVDAFLSVPRPDTTARTYAGTLERLAARLGRDRPLAGVADEKSCARRASCGGTWRRAPRTGTSPPSGRSHHGAATTVARRRPLPGRRPAHGGRQQLEGDPAAPAGAAVGRARDPAAGAGAVGGCDSAARAEEVLGLDVPDLDLANRQARARVKGGDIHLLTFETGAARLLAKLIAGREAGPVFLTERRAASHRVTAAADSTPKVGGPGCRTRWPSNYSSRPPRARRSTGSGTPG